MWMLLLGLVVWIGVHFFRRVSPSGRARFDDMLGQGPAKGVIALSLVVAIVLMVIGYGAAEHRHVYTPIAGIGHLNNLLMIFAVLLLGMGSSKGKMRTWFRHPMLMGAVVWAIAHLLVNGDLSSVILFGSLGLWAVAQMGLINRAEANWARPEAGPIKGDIKLVVISLVLFIVIVGIHTWLGYNLFAGTYA